jgi:16S rRNA (cytidine1402-2'-O)-methyltransferase
VGSLGFPVPPGSSNSRSVPRSLPSARAWHSILTAVPGHLLLCATPIGNLSDISARLQTALQSADLIYAEDTRRAAKLLHALDVSTGVRSFFVGNEQRRAVELRERLEAGNTIALITDAGMPAIADPGLSAVRAALEADAEITAIPGPSAVTTALAVSGLPTERFVFEGFLPRKAGERRTRISELAAETRTAVLFSGKAHLVADLADLADGLGGQRTVVVARELTKVYEEVWRGTLADAVATWSSREVRGEFTLVLGGAEPRSAPIDQLVAEVRDATEAGESMADAVRRIATESGVSRRGLYQAVLNDQE